MATEIERKFTVHPDRLPPLSNGDCLTQGYLNTDPGRTVRVRVGSGRAWLTIKGRGHGIMRPEYEYEIPFQDGAELLKMCPGTLIEKQRFSIAIEDLIWEVDVFQGSNEGLIIAEVELATLDTIVNLPDFIDLEVSEEPRYTNAALTDTPYLTW